MTEAEPVVSVLLGYRVMRGTAEGPRFVSRLQPDPGDVEWTADRDAALLFADRSQAAYVRRAIVIREERCAAVVPAEV